MDYGVRSNDNHEDCFPHAEICGSQAETGPQDTSRRQEDRETGRRARLDGPPALHERREPSARITAGAKRCGVVGRVSCEIGVSRSAFMRVASQCPLSTQSSRPRPCSACQCRALRRAGRATQTGCGPGECSHIVSGSPGTQIRTSQQRQSRQAIMLKHRHSGTCHLFLLLLFKL
ncbi:hypothetical protein BD289DRAFT_84534 [Coniella lustricola]|uniref:Uncharacterized protein n=1 Tax=Coniella lustricola TaxID=2025994 RepID=A0A2T3AHG1_9PEZI|nr:hypothetical protein BD289DRAFT_84534 [Coniella lustricola]